MTDFDMAEQAYRNGVADGKRQGRKESFEECLQILKTVQMLITGEDDTPEEIRYYKRVYARVLKQMQEGEQE